MIPLRLTWHGNNLVYRGLRLQSLFNLNSPFFFKTLTFLVKRIDFSNKIPIGQICRLLCNVGNLKLEWMIVSRRQKRSDY